MDDIFHCFSPVTACFQRYFLPGLIFILQRTILAFNKFVCVVSLNYKILLIFFFMERAPFKMVKMGTVCSGVSLYCWKVMKVGTVCCIETKCMWTRVRRAKQTDM